ncbi:unnamed protein product [Ixodes persulcatus]
MSRSVQRFDVEVGRKRPNHGFRGGRSSSWRLRRGPEDSSVPSSRFCSSQYHLEYKVCACRHHEWIPNQAAHTLKLGESVCIAERKVVCFLRRGCGDVTTPSSDWL